MPKCILMSFDRKQEAVQNMMLVCEKSFEERLISFVKLFSDAGSGRIAVFAEEAGASCAVYNGTATICPRPL